MGCTASKTSKPAATPATSQTEKPSQIPEGDFKVNVENATGGEGLGVVAKFPEKKYILVEDVKEEGLIPSWNTRNANTPEVQVKAGDAIVVVNGVFGDSDLMLAEVKAQAITLTVKRGQPTTSGPTVVTQEPGNEAPATKAAAAEAPAAEAPAAEAPPADAPAAGSPVPAAANPVVDATAAAGPVTEVPAAESPAAEPPAAESPPAEVPSTEAAVADPPAVEAPAAEAAVAEAPVAERSSEMSPAVDATAEQALAAELQPFNTELDGVVSVELGDAEMGEDKKEQRLCNLAVC